MSKLKLAGACWVSVFTLLVTGAFAQNYPTKPIRMIVAYPPGGGTDIVGRMIAQKLSENFGQTVVIDNRGGAAGGIGTEIAAKSVPDGYTILMGNVAPNAINVSLYAKLGYDPVRDFEPVSLVASTPNILVVQPSFAAKTIPDLIALAKAKPATLNYPSAGLGSSSHLAGELFDNLAGVKMVHIPYKGGGPALTDLLGGQVQLMFATMPAAMPHVRSGRLRAIAVTSVKRSQAMPDLPTIGETLKGYDASTWYGVLAPVRTPHAVVMTLHDEIIRILGAAEMRERLLAQGFEPVGGTPAEFAAYIKSEIAKWGKVIKAAGIKPE